MIETRRASMLEKIKTNLKPSIIGYEKEKKKLKNMAILIFEKNQEKLNEILSINGKILMYGRPGVGKTSLAYYLGNYVYEKFGAESYKINIHELITADLGKTTKNMYETLEKVKSKGEYGALIILDEIDRLCVNRLNDNELSELKRATIVLMDFLDEITYKNNILIVGITNVIDQIDPAIKRRFDIISEIESTEDQLKKYTKNLLEELQLKIDVEYINKEFYEKHSTCDEIMKFFKTFYLEVIELDKIQEKDVVKQKIIKYLKGEKYVNEISGS